MAKMTTESVDAVMKQFKYATGHSVNLCRGYPPEEIRNHLSAKGVLIIPPDDDRVHLLTFSYEPEAMLEQFRVIGFEQPIETNSSASPAMEAQ